MSCRVVGAACWMMVTIQLVTAARALLAENGLVSPITGDLVGLDAITRGLYFADTLIGPTAADSMQRRARLTPRLRASTMSTARDSHADTSACRSVHMLLAHHSAGTQAQNVLDSQINEAVRTFPTAPCLRRPPTGLGTQRTLRPGVEFPSVSLPALAVTDAVTTYALFAGQLTLIDFWATWCTPCLGETPVLHRTSERFKGCAFSILNVSADESVQSAVTLRRDMWAKPWTHAWAGSGLTARALMGPGVIGPPTAVLVDGTGRIVAVDDGLRGQALERTLAIPVTTPVRQVTCARGKSWSHRARRSKNDVRNHRRSCQLVVVRDDRSVRLARGQRLSITCNERNDAAA